MNIFETRTFNTDEKNIIKNTIQDIIQGLTSINEIKEHIKENSKDVCDRLNEKIVDKDSFIKPSLLMKLAKTKMKENIFEQKEAINEIEGGLKEIYE